MRNRINYKEDSDDESKKSKKRLVKKSQVSETLHVTGDNLEGYNEGMKEVLHKKKQKTPRKKKSEEAKDIDDDMNGFTEEMKQIAMRKKSSRKKNSDKVVTTNRIKIKSRTEISNSDVSEAE